MYFCFHFFHSGSLMSRAYVCTSYLPIVWQHVHWFHSSGSPCEAGVEHKSGNLTGTLHAPDRRSIELYFRCFKQVQGARAEKPQLQLQKTPCPLGPQDHKMYAARSYRPAYFTHTGLQKYLEDILQRQTLVKRYSWVYTSHTRFRHHKI